jgi:hypothetical protein
MLKHYGSPDTTDSHDNVLWQATCDWCGEVGHCNGVSKSGAIEHFADNGWFMFPDKRSFCSDECRIADVRKRGAALSTTEASQ